MALIWVNADAGIAIELRLFQISQRSSGRHQVSGLRSFGEKIMNPLMAGDGVGDLLR
jgi:hypothetical protein